VRHPHRHDHFAELLHVTEPVTTLKIDNPVGNTQIEGIDTNTISVTEQLSYAGNLPLTSYPINAAHQLTLSYTCPGIFDVHSCSQRVRGN
jgi:hypothetical protein